MKQRLGLMEAKKSCGKLPKKVGGIFVLITMALIMLCAFAMAQENGVDYWLNKGNSFISQSKYNESLEAFDRAIELIPANDTERLVYIWKMKAFPIYKIYGPEETIKVYDKILDLNSSDISAWLSKGGLLADLERYNESIDAIDRAIQIDPNFAAAWLGKGEILNRTGRYEESIQSLDKAIELDPTSSTAWEIKSDALNALGRYS